MGRRLVRLDFRFRRPDRYSGPPRSGQMTYELERYWKRRSVANVAVVRINGSRADG